MDGPVARLHSDVLGVDSLRLRHARKTNVIYVRYVFG